MIQWAAYAFNKDIVVLGVAEENTDKTKRKYSKKWVQNKKTKEQKES